VAFAIEVTGSLHGALHRRLVELVGADALDEHGGRTVVSVQDQAAMIGVIHLLNDLGLDIDRVEQT
jgi:hypothetical protein